MKTRCILYLKMSKWILENTELLPLYPQIWIINLVLWLIVALWYLGVAIKVYHAVIFTLDLGTLSEPVLLFPIWMQTEEQEDNHKNWKNERGIMCSWFLAPSHAIWSNWLGYSKHLNSQEYPETIVPVTRNLEVSQCILILKWKENEIFPHFSIKEGKESHIQWRKKVIKECNLQCPEKPQSIHWQ